MSFARYPKYKDSGGEWLGEVPAHWEVRKLLNLARLESGHTPSRQHPEYWVESECVIPWFTLADVGFLRDEKNTSIETTSQKISELGMANSAARMLPPGTVILSRTASVGFSGITSIPLAVSQDFAAWICGERIQPRFLLLCLRAMKQEFKRLMMGSTHQTIYMPDIEAFKVPVPGLAEQARIVRFVEYEAAKIDGLIDEQRRLMELLKEKRQAVISHAVTKGLNPAAVMKPSGIEWLGDVPSNWVVAPIGSRYSVQLGKMLDSVKITGEHLRPYLRVADVQWGEINISDLPEMDFNDSDRAKFRIFPGDLMVNEGGSYPGRAAIWRGALEECYYQKALHRVRAINPAIESAEFLYYVIQCAAHAGAFVAGGNETTIEHLPAEKLRRFRVAFPPLAEQACIAEYLEVKTAKLDALNAEAQRAIDLLQERRMALISAAVTGQIDVRDLA